MDPAPTRGPRRPLWSRRRFLIAGGAALAAAAEGGILEPNWLEVTRHQVVMPGLPEPLAGLRVTQLSDLHRSPFVSAAQVRAVVDRSNALAPDLVALTGDYVTRQVDFIDYIDSCAAELGRLHARLGVFAVLGNHDHWTDAERVTAALERRGIHVLTNAAAEPSPGFWIAGVDDSWAGRPSLRRALGPVPREQCPVLLTHNPNLCRRAMVRPMLALCGHTHGCQVYVPGVTPHLLPGMRGCRFVRGWYAERDGQVYVNRGTGVTTLPVRFCSRPEVSLFTLQPPNDLAAPARVTVRGPRGE
jgi:predicted MPP superfamily phosphohydrolase